MRISVAALYMVIALASTPQMYTSSRFKHTKIPAANWMAVVSIQDPVVSKTFQNLLLGLQVNISQNVMIT